MQNKIRKEKYLDKSKNKLFYDAFQLITPKYNYKLKKKHNFKKKKPKIKFKYCLTTLLTVSIIIVISFILFNVLHLSSKNIISKFTKIFKHKPSKKDIYFKEIFPNLQDSFNNAKEFLKICLEGKLISNKTIKPSENPKVSAVIPLYNCKRTILRSIRSIQNQNISDLEIILVNDFSTDESLSIVEQFQKEDPRIKIINNQRNMGILYSRSIGALAAKGKYIFPLDDDDMLLDNDVYYTITKIADKCDFDIVGFKALSASISSNSLPIHAFEAYYQGQENNQVLFQPELGLYPLRNGSKYGEYYIYDVYLWDKCIKTDIYQKALNKVGAERYSRHMIIHEDVVETCFLFNTAESLKYLGKYGTLHIPTPGSGSWRRFDEKIRNIYNLYVTDVAIDFTKDTFESRRILVYLITYILEKPSLKETLEQNEYIKNLFISCLKKILKMKYISNVDKEEIRKRAEKIDFLKTQMDL